MKILVVEDEPAIAMGLRDDLRLEGFDVEVAGDGLTAERRAREGGLDLIVLDIMLPGKDGLAVCRSLRQAGIATPIVALTAKAQEMDRVLGLEFGADDYVTKPFDPRELLSRARNLIRRVHIQQRQRKKNHIRKFAGWTLDLNKRELTSPEGEANQLSAGEYQLLLSFMEKAGEVMNRDQIMNRIRNREWFPDDRYIDVLVGQLRKKLGERAATAKIISTIHGTGYLFTPEVV